MAYSGNEISFMDYTKGKRYNDYGTYNYGSAAYEIDFEKRRKEENKRIFHQGHSAAAPDQGDA